MCLGLGLAPAALSAGGHPADVFGAQVLVAPKKFPQSAASKDKYVKTLKTMRKKQLFQDKETKKWTIHFAAFFKKPLNDLEVTIRLYDVTEGTKKMVASFEQYLGKRGERSFHSSMTLDDKQIPVNRKVLMEIVNKGRVLAQAQFDLVGEAEKYSGQVDFSDE